MFINPYQKFSEQNIPIRANFHTHAGTGKFTCGHHRLKEVLQNYQRLGYGAICISNHHYSVVRIGKLIFPNPLLWQGCVSKMLIVPGFEYTFDSHLVCVGTKKFLFKKDAFQEAIDMTEKDGGFSILAHPHWRKDWCLSKELIERLHGYAGIEILNAGIEFSRAEFKERENKAYAGDVYDYILSRGDLKWAFANDDFHRWNHLANAWNMIYCKKKSEDLYRAVKCGEFYASTGVTLRYLHLDGNVLSVACRNAEFVVEKMRYRFIGFQGKVLKEEEGTEASYVLQGDEKYVRVEVVSPSGTMLFSNPVYDSEFFNK